MFGKVSLDLSIEISALQWKISVKVQISSNAFPYERIAMLEQRRNRGVYNTKVEYEAVKTCKRLFRIIDV